MTRARFLQIVIVGGATLLVEALCRFGVITRFTMIPPTEMAVSLFALARGAPWFWPDVLYSLRNLAFAALIAILGGF